MNLTPSLIAIAAGARIDRAERRHASLVAAMKLYDISTPMRAAMFLANVGHETGGLKYLVEIWGPTMQQRRYERDFKQPWPRTLAESRQPAYAANRLAWGLGNAQQGDGLRYLGRGDFQTTGRGNYIRLRDRLRARFPGLDVPDFEAQPDQVADPKWAAIAAADYCAMKDCNAMADAGDFDGYCDLINKGRKTEDEGDTNGYEHRLALYTRGLPALQVAA
ncbi:MAG: glycoside hydrolase family 19 protein [Ramlibacter sp.]